MPDESQNAQAPIPPQPAPEPAPLPPGTPEPVLAPVPPPAPAPGTPPPVTPAAPPPPPGSSTMPKKSKAGLVIGMVVVLLLALGGGGWYWWQSRNKTTAVVDTPTPSTSNSAVSAENCGAKVSDWIDDTGQNLGKRIDPEDTPYGMSLDNTTGANDAITEYCAATKMREQAESYIDTLSQKNWEKAYTYLSTGAKTVPFETKKANWVGEYGPYTFSLKTALGAGTDLEKHTVVSYRVEPCLKDRQEGWTKNIVKGYYTSPVITLDKEHLVDTVIALAMVKQDGTWKIDGEANQLTNIDALNDKDAYAKAQAARSYKPYDCDL